MSDQKALQQKCIERIKECIDIANMELGLKRKILMPTVSFDKKGQGGGTYYPKRHHIKLNNAYLIAYKDRYISEVPGHEVAHAIAEHIEKNGKPHGQIWKIVMMAIGQKPKVKHDLNPVGVMDGYIYECGCDQYLLSKIRHNRVVRLGVVYRCKKCGKRCERVKDGKSTVHK